MVTAVSVSSATSLKQNAASNISVLRCACLTMNLSQETSPHKKLKYLQEETVKNINNATIHLHTPYIYTILSTSFIHCTI
jgi:hypothetical protein